MYGATILYGKGTVSGKIGIDDLEFLWVKKCGKVISGVWKFSASGFCLIPVSIPY